jgi:NAD-dependent deacetylase
MRSAQTMEPARCAELIRQAGKVIVLTGAGLSTAAGIPDFRGPQGLYVTRRYDPEKVFEADWFRHEPRFFYEFARDFVEMVKDVEPTFTHRFLADMEKKGLLEAVITQNIDMLHQLAGNRAVIELHGSPRAAYCTSCGKRFVDLTYPWWEKVMNSSPNPPVPFCPACLGVIKPEIVFFGETLDWFGEAERLVYQCDLLMVLGSSLQVAPAALLPQGTKATTVIVNKGPVMLPPAPNRYFVDGDLDEYFREVARHLE